MDISNNIRILRKKRGLNQFELSEEIGVSVDSVRRWESNKQFPRADELFNLASIFNVTVDELLHGNFDDKIELVVSWNWEEMKKGEIDMNEEKFKLILDVDGKVGIQGAGKITSMEAIEEFLGRIRNELVIALDTQIRRGVVQPVLHMYKGSSEYIRGNKVKENVL